jgi:membrane protease YdiL (CAAX protease family)
MAPGGCYTLPRMLDLPSTSAAGAPVQSAPRHLPLFSVRASILCALVVAVLTIPSLIVSPAGSPIDLLRQPEDSLDRLVTRQMDLAEAMRRAPLWQRALAALFVSADPASEVAAWYDEVADAFDSPQAQLYREVLVREAGRGAADAEGPPAADAQRSAEPAADPLSGQVSEWLSAAYPAPDDLPLDRERARALIAEIRAMLPAGWLSDTLVARIAARSGDVATGAEAEAAIAARGRLLLGRTVALGAGNVLLALAGAAVLAAGRGRMPLLGDAPLPPTWLALDGLGLFLRGAAAFLVLASLSGMLIPGDTLAEPVAAMLAGVPMLLLTRSCLVAYGTSMTAAFGLRLGPGRARALAAATLALVALSVAADILIALGAEMLGLASHWADGFPEELLWSPPGVVALHLADTVFWTPFIEEVTFRGVLYGTLRRRLPVWSATLLTAAVFAAAHGYGVVGFASVFTSGALWTLAYERTRSLLPGMVAHGANNLMVAVDALALLRL